MILILILLIIADYVNIDELPQVKGKLRPFRVGENGCVSEYIQSKHQSVRQKHVANSRWCIRNCVLIELGCTMELLLMHLLKHLLYKTYLLKCLLKSHLFYIWRILYRLSPHIISIYSLFVVEVSTVRPLIL